MKRRYGLAPAKTPGSHRQIKQTARKQIAENGAGNLSLGAIARALGMTPPALYRYFDNRDALITALIIDAYDSMGEVMEHAADGLPADDYCGTIPCFDARLSCSGQSSLRRISRLCMAFLPEMW